MSSYNFCFECNFQVLFYFLCVNIHILGGKHMLYMYDEMEELCGFVGFFEVIGMICKLMSFYCIQLIVYYLYYKVDHVFMASI